MSAGSRWGRILRFALVSGTVASATSAACLAVLARAEGKGMLQPLNATSHWLNGDGAGLRRQADFLHTGTGYATHHAATLFWALCFERWILARRPLRPLPLFANALALSAIAVVVDYRATPKRFTPGWEFVLSRRAMAATYAAMGGGLTGGALLTQHRAPKSWQSGER